MSSQMKPSWPWEWIGEEAAVPALEHDGKLAGEPVYRVRGTEDLELAYEIVQPDGSADSFPVALRRAIGLVRLSGDDRNDRDLRLVQGSALDRLLSDKGLRSRMASELAKNDVKNELTTEAQTALKNLDTAFQRESLPAGLDLAITGGQGPSIASMIGLTADRSGIQLPLASWGAGTRRLSALAIDEGKHPTRWAKLHTKLGQLLFRWPALCIEENIIAVVSDDKLEGLITAPIGKKTGIHLRTLADISVLAMFDLANPGAFRL
ncbi:hypothetical protein ABIB82_000009 [Bradyrhizobium sp. i1.8.4]|uniref:hypothetical protein n=1 Tax=unclassified Bradyrhizobium TaxID=2631580 RepID=UPI003D23F270